MSQSMHPGSDRKGLVNLTATEAARAIREGSVSSVELVGACLDRIAERDSGTGAWAHLDRDKALADARRADEWRASGRGIGPLHGVPVGVKDIIDTADYPTENGCPLYAGNQPRADAACVTALRSAGAVILGKTVTTELALLTPATTHHPAAPGNTSGGSSAGSAAAVADFMVPAALGTQTAGSVLRPASYCGIYGFKPTLGLVPRSGVLMQSHTLDTVGVLARSIEDAALLTEVMARFDPDDPVSFPRSTPPLLATSQSDPPATPTFAFMQTPAWDQMQPAAREAFDELTSELGGLSQPVDFTGLDQVIEWQRIVQLAENASYYGRLQERGRDQFSDGLNARLDEGAKVPVADYITAVAARDAATRSFDDLFENVDAILTPASPGTAPPISDGITGSPIFNGLWTYLGMPCISIPLMEIDGLPCGVQLVGPRRDDARLLRTAKWLVRNLMPDAADGSEQTLSV